ncbi:MAG: hypothetical protein J5822_05555 [Eubacteriaceae bacterium]|nr:hypothetical protein [Eubacteriaceae bacterium]
MDKKDKELKKELNREYPERAIRNRNELFSMKDKFDRSVAERSADDPGMEDVYAGPEYFENNMDENDGPREEPIFEAVYNGPDFYEQRDSNLHRVPMERVYAGPEMMKKGGRPSASGGSFLKKEKGRFCPCCGTQRKEDEKFCSSCGAAFED